MTANKPMTGAQLDELMAVAMRMQSDSEKMGERSVSMFAYAVQVAVLEIRETRCKYEELQSQNADMAVQLANAESKCRELAAENAALKGVVSGVNSELYGQGFEVSGWHLNGALEPLDNWFTDNGWGMPETPATDAFLAEVRAQGVTEYASKRGFSFQHGSIHAHFGNGDVMVGSVTFENGDAGINFAPVREKTGGVGTHYDWTKGKTAEQVDSIFVIASSNAEGLEVIRDKLSEAIAQLRKGAAL
ncbi:hypothetical protein NX410_000210 [Salmonella enterica]|nr:hypothetical protein [Salmonella enterica]EJJ9938994.1 hypothetical protein [Salmonella enterica]EJQ4623967.1 hypothetical protein [Salmonella enterica]